MLDMIWFYISFDHWKWGVLCANICNTDRIRITSLVNWAMLTCLFVCVNAQISDFIKAREIKFGGKIPVYYMLIKFISSVAKCCHAHIQLLTNKQINIQKNLRIHQVLFSARFMLFIWLNQFAFCCMSWRWKNVNRPSMEKRCDLKASFLKLGKEKLICLVYGLTKGLLQKLKSVEIIDIHAKKIVVLIFFELKLPIKKSQKLFSKKAFVNISDYYQLYTTHIFL